MSYSFWRKSYELRRETRKIWLVRHRNANINWIRSSTKMKSLAKNSGSFSKKTDSSSMFLRQSKESWWKPRIGFQILRKGQRMFSNQTNNSRISYNLLRISCKDRRKSFKSYKKIMKRPKLISFLTVKSWISIKNN